MICLSRRQLLGCLGLPLLGLLLLAVSAPWWLRGLGHWLAGQPPEGQRAEVIVVLSGGGPSRLNPGIEAFQQGGATELWYTGATRPEEARRFNDAAYAREYALEHGIPATAIRLLETSSTWEDGEQIAVASREREPASLLVVTDWSHARRARCVIRYHLAEQPVALHGLPVQGPSVSNPDDWWRSEEGLVSVLNELVKLLYYWQRYGLAPWSCA